MKLLLDDVRDDDFVGRQALGGRESQHSCKPVVVDFAKSLGKIRALHGVNNGPVCLGRE